MGGVVLSGWHGDSERGVLGTGTQHARAGFSLLAASVLCRSFAADVRYPARACVLAVHLREGERFASPSSRTLRRASEGPEAGRREWGSVRRTFRTDPGASLA